MVEIARPYDALVAGDIEAALAWYEKRRANLIGNPVQAHNWARLLCSVGRRTEAEALFPVLENLDDYTMFVAGQRLISELEKGRSPPEALEAVPLAAAAPHKNAIAAAMAEFDIARTPPETRHIAICGVSFCGSTLLDMLLEGLPGVASIGESVWLTLSYIDGRPAARNFTQAQGRGVQECNFCGRGCEVLTPTFRNALGLNPIDWYFKVGERLRTPVLVSSDKNLPKIVLFEPKLRLQGLVVFKSPKQAWASNLSKMKLDLSEHEYREAMIKYMAIWKDAYSELAHSFRPRDGKVFLDFDRFADRPETAFRAITEALGLEFDPMALINPEHGHSLGGNSNAIRGVQDASYQVKIRPLGKPAIPDEHAEWIDSQADLTELHYTLSRLADEVTTVAV